MGKIRIIGGMHRSRVLPVLDSPGLRPTLDRVKESLFNWLEQNLTGRTCLDLFAGSGSLGFEAISRNAKQVVMIEKDAKVVKQLKDNLTLLKIDNAEVHQADALVYLDNCQLKFDVVFLDPPYQTDLLKRALAIVAKNLNPDGVVYIEYADQPDLTGFNLLKQAKAGIMYYALLNIEE